MCNVISRYSPQYVRSRALQQPLDALLVLVRAGCGCARSSCDMRMYAQTRTHTHTHGTKLPEGVWNSMHTHGCAALLSPCHRDVSATSLGRWAITLPAWLLTG